MPDIDVSPTLIPASELHTLPLDTYVSFKHPKFDIDPSGVIEMIGRRTANGKVPLVIRRLNGWKSTYYLPLAHPVRLYPASS